MMNNPPSHDPDAQQSGYPGQAQESQMVYGYPEQTDQMGESEGMYGYPHAAGFPQPGYPPTQPMDAQAQMNYMDYAGLQQPGSSMPQQPGNTFLGKMGNSLWIALTALALLLLVAGGSIYYYFQVRSTPEKTLQTYCNAIKNDDSHALYNTYSSEAQSQTDEAHLQQGLRLIEFFSGGIEDCSVNAYSIHENDPQATASITFTLSGGRMSDVRLHLIDENGQWKVENNAILP